MIIEVAVFVVAWLRARESEGTRGNQLVGRKREKARIVEILSRDL